MDNVQRTFSIYVLGIVLLSMGFFCLFVCLFVCFLTNLNNTQHRISVLSSNFGNKELVMQPGVNSIKKYKRTLQVGPLFLQIHTNLYPLKVFTSSR